MWGAHISLVAPAQWGLTAWPQTALCGGHPPGVFAPVILGFLSGAATCILSWCRAVGAGPCAAVGGTGSCEQGDPPRGGGSRPCLCPPRAPPTHTACQAPFSVLRSAHHRGSACPWEASVFGSGVREQIRSLGGDSSLEKITAEKGARGLRGGEGLLFYRKAWKNSSWDKVALGQRPPLKEPAHPGEECLGKGPAA